jgi:hypothetical protein
MQKSLEANPNQGQADSKQKQKAASSSQDAARDEAAGKSVTSNKTKLYVYYQRIHSAKIGYIRLSDGSFWAVKSRSAAKALLWRKNEKVQVKVKDGTDPFRGFFTEFINLDRNEETIEVKLVELPDDSNSPLVKLVLKRDITIEPSDLHSIHTNIMHGSVIKLHNEAEFNIAPLHMHATRFWRPGQRIRLSYNKDNVAHPFTLYNMETKERVEARLNKPPAVPHRLWIYDPKESADPDAKPLPDPFLTY